MYGLLLYAQSFLNVNDPRTNKGVDLWLPRSTDGTDFQDI
jgi:hypothetical protein